MFLSAVRIGLVLLGGWHNQLSPREEQAWKRILPETMLLTDGSYVAGRAALIDPRGYFIAHRTSVPKGVLTGKTSDGKTYRVVRKAIDEPSGLVLLEAEKWNKPGLAPVQVALGSLDPGTPLLSVIGPGPIPSEFVSSDKFGVLAPSRRLVPLMEVKFESSPNLVGGALVFDYDGRFLGALNATLDAKADAQAPSAAPMESLTARGNPAFKVSHVLLPQYGPSQLTVAYTVGSNALKQVIDGFRTPSHQVWRPQLGVMCKDAEGGGAWVESVIPDSPAENVGIRAGDVIFQIGNSAVNDQVSFAKAMLNQTAGATVNVYLLRNGEILMHHVTLGKSKD